MSNDIQSKVKDLEEFTSPFYELKELSRSGWISKLNLKNPETVASHTLLMIVLVLYFGSNKSYSCRKKLRLIEMVLVHDLAESVIGDITPDSDKYLGKKKLENKVFAQMMSVLPHSTLKDEFKSCWKEFSSNSSIDSKIVHVIDKLEMLIQANHYLKNRDNITSNQIEPFRKSAISSIENGVCTNNFNDHELSEKEKREMESMEDLTEIKEILAYLCK